MHLNERALLRVANAVSAQLTRTETPRVDLPDYRWAGIQRSLRRANVCRLRGWHVAAARVLDGLRWQMVSLGSQLEKLAVSLAPPAQIVCPASTHDVYRDLLALREEFGDVACDLKAGTVSITTEPVTFDKVELGPFEIRLEFRQLRQPSPYRVIALKPNRPPNASRVTHPHVLEDNLCEGNGKAAIRIALAEGRLHDFFLIVSRLLLTYPVNSVYEALSAWNTHACEDCGDHGDDIGRCNRCQAEVCSGCQTDCPGCRAILCGSCTAGCRYCPRLYCSSCLKLCSRCRAKVCSDCRVHGLCPDCQPEEFDDDQPTLDADDLVDIQAGDEIDTEPALPEALADSAVQPDGLGEVAVPA
jgi:hypothetical protein